MLMPELLQTVNLQNPGDLEDPRCSLSVTRGETILIHFVQGAINSVRPNEGTQDV